MRRAKNIVAALRWLPALRGPAMGWIGAFLLGLLTAAGPGEAAVTLNPGDILIGASGRVIRVNPANGEPTVLVTGVQFDNPTGIAIAKSGDLFVVDPGAGVIRVNLATGNQTVVASGGHFNEPRGIAIGANGDLFVVDSGAGVIRVNPANGGQTVVASGGHFRKPRGIAIAANGDLFVADGACCGGDQGGVIRVNPASGGQTVVTSEGNFGEPTGIAIASNGDLFVVDPKCCDSLDGGVIRVNLALGNQPPGYNQTLMTAAGSLLSPEGVAIAANGFMFVADPRCCGHPSPVPGPGGVIQVDPFAGPGPPNKVQTIVWSGSNFFRPLSIAIVPPPDPGDFLIANVTGGNILAVNQRMVSPWSGWDPMVVSQGGYFDGSNPPAGIAAATTGEAFVTGTLARDGFNGVVRVNPDTGHQTLVSADHHFVQPQGIAIAANGDLFVADVQCCGGQGGVIRVDPTNGSQTVVSSGGHLAQPWGIAIATNGDLFVAGGVCCDGQSGVIRVDPTNGTQTPVSSGGFFVGPVGIAIAANGDLFVLDEACCGPGGGSPTSGAVIRVNPVNGSQRVVSSGASFISPTGIAIAANGDLFVLNSACCGPGSTLFSGGVLRVDPNDGHQTAWAPGGDFFPSGIAVVPPRPQLGLPPPASCGGSVPCSCGDRVVSDRTLRGGDPVSRAACPADGLVVAAGVTLDLGGATLRGQGAGAGVRIEAGATGVTIRRGRLSGFATGVRGEGATGVHLANVQVLDSVHDGVNLTGDGHEVETATIQGSGHVGVAVVGDGARLSRLQVRNNGRAGVRLVGGGHTLEQSAIEGNGEAGAEVSGDGNHVTLLQLEGNGGDGMFATGTGNQAARNVATRNGGDGLEIQGQRAVVEANRATSNRGAGLEIHGTGHTVSVNVAGQNAGTGLEMRGTTGSRFNRNRGENNGGFGISDDSAGTGTGGTANAYADNICGRGNRAGVSSPPGLCR